VGDNAYLVYAGLMLLMLVSSFIVQSRGKGGEVWRAARLWAVIITALVIGIAFWPDIKPRVQGMFDPSGAQAINGRIVFRKSNDEHFYARLFINGEPVEFVVDTGATDLVLTKADAARAGIDVKQINFNQVVQTANGTTRSAQVILNTVELGSKRFTGVSAAVNEGDLDVSLLGMRFLNRFGSIKITSEQMELTP
jgi:aspartyl protease family protein